MWEGGRGGGGGCYGVSGGVFKGDGRLGSGGLP